MQSITTIGLDIAKSVFQVHGIDAVGQVVMRRQLKRRYVLKFFEKLPPCLVGIEACASSHHWSRELEARLATIRTFKLRKALSVFVVSIVTLSNAYQSAQRRRQVVVQPIKKTAARFAVER